MLITGKTIEGDTQTFTEKDIKNLQNDIDYCSGVIPIFGSQIHEFGAVKSGYSHFYFLLKDMEERDKTWFLKQVEKRAIRNDNVKIKPVHIPNGVQQNPWPTADPETITYYDHWLVVEEDGVEIGRLFIDHSVGQPYLWYKAPSEDFENLPILPANEDLIVIDGYSMFAPAFYWKREKVTV